MATAIGIEVIKLLKLTDADIICFDMIGEDALSVYKTANISSNKLIAEKCNRLLDEMKDI